MSNAPPSAVSKAPGEKSTSVWRVVGRVVSRAIIVVASVTLAVGVLTVILVFHKAAPPVVHVDRVGARRLEANLQQAEAAAAAGAPRVVRVNEAELNSFLDSHLALNRGTAARNAAGSVRDVKINLIDDLLQVYVVLSLPGKDMTVDLEGKLHSNNGYVQFDPLSARIGALSIPRSALLTAMRRMMDSPQAREELRLPNNLRDLRVEDSKIVVVYK